MGNRQSQQPVPRHDFNGPLFGGHYPGDFSIIRGVGYCSFKLDIRIWVPSSLTTWAERNAQFEQGLTTITEYQEGKIWLRPTVRCYLLIK